MVTRLEYAILANAVYNNGGEVPDGWSQILRDYDGNGTIEGYKESATGFAAAAYSNDDEIIISYRGTSL